MNEAQNIEWKQSWRDEYLQWICAFANTEGGMLYIGKDDKGNTVHLTKYKSLLEDIPSKIKNHMGIICPVNLKDDNGDKYIEIEVKAYANPISYKGKYYIRSGSSTHELNGVELQEFLLAKSGKTWDDLFVEEATIADVDPVSVKKLIDDSKAKGRLPDIEGLTELQILDKLHLADGDKIKRAGIVLFGKDPNRFFPNCKVMIGRFGKDSEDLKFQEPLEGNVVFLLDEVQKMLNYKFLTRPIDFEGMHRVEGDEYPVAALREVLLNALVHKKYMGAAIQIRVFDDKLSVWNEGELPNGLTIDDLKNEHNSRPSNPVLADACFKAGYIDTWGRGTMKIYKACAEAGMPEPQIIEKNGGIEVTLFKVAGETKVSEEIRSNFGAISEEISNDPKKNKLLIVTNYEAFIKYISDKFGLSSDELRRNFGETSEKYFEQFSNKGILLFLIALNTSITANEAAEKIGVSSRTIETYIADLKKEELLERIGADKGGHWKITLPKK